jgi:polysaccharide deacetylase family protein (PEP-CTERM system associated)
MPGEKNILITVDVEDWFQVENFKPYISFDSWDSRELRVEKNTHTLLDLFDSFRESSSKSSEQLQRPGRAQGTFFVLGWIAERMPHLVREIQNRGHEVASHGFGHELCNRKAYDDLREDLAKSKKIIEDIIGSEIYGYRAPSFSINNHILGMIAEAGYQYDSSYNSFDKHGRYGKLSTQGLPKIGLGIKVSESFWELPVSNLKIGNRILPWSGGGYFRLIPGRIFHLGVQAILNNDSAYNLYVHPWELDPDQPRVKAASKMSKFRHYVNLSNTEKKLDQLLKRFHQCRFIGCREYLQHLQLLT